VAQTDLGYDSRPIHNLISGLGQFTRGLPGDCRCLRRAIE
jgi:hypothetical protein